MSRYLIGSIAGLLSVAAAWVAPAGAQERSLAVQEQKAQAAAPGSRFAQIPIFAVNSGAHAGTVPQVAVTPDERYLVTVGFDRTVRIWDARTGEPRRQYFMPAAGPNDAN